VVSEPPYDAFQSAKIKSSIVVADAALGSDAKTAGLVRCFSSRSKAATNVVAREPDFRRILPWSQCEKAEGRPVGTQLFGRSVPKVAMAPFGRRKTNSRRPRSVTVRLRAESLPSPACGIFPQRCRRLLQDRT